jgi:hypothetical protein
MTITEVLRAIVVFNLLAVVLVLLPATLVNARRARRNMLAGHHYRMAKLAAIQGDEAGYKRHMDAATAIPVKGAWPR